MHLKGLTPPVKIINTFGGCLFGIGYLCRMNKKPILASTLFGLEPVLADELKALGAENITIHNRIVAFEGDQELIYKSNLYCRTALRILLPIQKFTAEDEIRFYNAIKSMDWERYMRVGDTIAVYATVNSNVFTHSHFIALKAKDAIADYFREKKGRRPNVDTQNPDLTVRIHIFKNECTVMIDSSGDSLHMRGYRQEKVAAPLNEALAAGMVLLSGWDKLTPFVDPMCGSGTIIIEAAMLAMNKAPGLLRETFAFQKWRDYDPSLWERLKSEAENQIKMPEAEMLAADKEPRASSITRQNMDRAGVAGVTVVRKEFHRLEPPQGNGIVCINPPYGERMKEEEIEEFYKAIGDTLKKNWKGYTAWILSSNKAAIKRVGLRTSQKLTLFNGPLECKYHRFDLY